MADNLHRVVVIGGGFGGLYAARSLARAPVDLTLIDRRNFHLFQPLLYQVATGGLSPANIAMPLRALLKRQKNARVMLGEVSDIDVFERCVRLNDAAIPYDTLIVAAGSRHAYFGHDEWEPNAPGLKTIEDATDIRRRVLLAFEAAEQEIAADRRQAWLRFAIVGGGPTGVELAGAIGELARYTLRRNFRRIDPADAEILLVESADRVLPSFPPELSTKAEQSLARLGISVRTKTLVTEVSPVHVEIRSGDRVERVAARTVLWAAGAQASPLGLVLARAAGATLDRSGRVAVQPDLSVPGHPDVLVIGDLSLFTHQTGRPLPGVAPVAMQQGRYVADLIQRRLRNQTLPPFRYRDKGNLATIGRAAAVADFGWLRLSGYPAWVLWIFIHLMYLIQFDNRLLVLFQWAWNYITRNRSARLITAESSSKGLAERAREV